MRQRSVIKLFEWYLTLRSRRTSAASPMGPQIDRLRLGLVGVSGGFNPSNVEERNLTYSVLVNIFGELSPQAHRLLEILASPKRHALGCTLSEVPDPASNELKCECGAVKFVDRRAMIGDLETHQREGDEAQQETKTGGRYLRLAENADGSKSEDEVIVRESRQTYPTHEEAANALGVDVKEVRALLRRADRGVRTSQGYQALFAYGAA